MSHGSQTRRQRGGNTGVKGRRSREGAGLGESLRATDAQGNLKQSARKAIRTTEQMWNNISHEWFGTNKKTFPYNMNKRNQAPSLITQESGHPPQLKIEQIMSKLGSRNSGRSNPSKPAKVIEMQKEKDVDEAYEHFLSWRNQNAYGER